MYKTNVKYFSFCNLFVIIIYGIIYVMKMEHYEIERKFIIRRPERQYLEKHGSVTQIIQTYLIGKPGETTRVRKRWNREYTSYTLTIKSRVNAMRQIERERELRVEEYQELLKTADPERKPIRKERWVVEYRGQRFEIDVFPFWEHQAYLELELQDECQTIDFPPELEIICEVTGDSRYTNRGLAKEIPPEIEKEP